MACRISELVIDAADRGRLAAFWSRVLGYVELAREDDGSIEIGPPDAGFGGPALTRNSARRCMPGIGLSFWAMIGSARLITAPVAWPGSHAVGSGARHRR